MRELARGLREENLDEITMSVGAGGYSAAADPKGPVAGFDPVQGKMQKRKKPVIIYLKGARKNWKK